MSGTSDFSRRLRWNDRTQYAGSGGRLLHRVFADRKRDFGRGKWVNGEGVGLDWDRRPTTLGRAFGLDESAKYADSTAVLQGLIWGADQKAAAVVSTGSPIDKCYQEVELRLRTVVSPHSISGYEINYKFSNDSTAYMTIVRWNGPLGNFTTLQTLNGQQFGVTNDDVVTATVVGNVITAYKNGVQQGRLQTAPIRAEVPGWDLISRTT